MMAMRVVVVDDEPLVRRDLERMLASEVGVEVVGSASNGIEALAEIDAHHPDVVFLDVQMPGLDGLGVVEALAEEDPPLVVFVTAFDRYALAAFEADAVDYLLKPFDAPRLARTVARLRERLAARESTDAGQWARLAASARAPGSPWPERLAVRAAGRVVIVELSEVRWVEAAGNYARLHLADRSFLTRRTMQRLEDTLDPARFIRIHRSHIVNLRHVRELRPLGDGDLGVVLAGGRELVATRTYRGALESRFGGMA